MDKDENNPQINSVETVTNEEQKQTIDANHQNNDVPECININKNEPQDIMQTVNDLKYAEENSNSLKKICNSGTIILDNSEQNVTSCEETTSGIKMDSVYSESQTLSLNQGSDNVSVSSVHLASREAEVGCEQKQAEQVIEPNEKMVQGDDRPEKFEFEHEMLERRNKSLDDQEGETKQASSWEESTVDDGNRMNHFTVDRNKVVLLSNEGELEDPLRFRKRRAPRLVMDLPRLLIMKHHVSSQPSQMKKTGKSVVKKAVIQHINRQPDPKQADPKQADPKPVKSSMKRKPKEVDASTVPPKTEALYLHCKICDCYFSTLQRLQSHWTSCKRKVNMSKDMVEYLAKNPVYLIPYELMDMKPSLERSSDLDTMRQPQCEECKRVFPSAYLSYLRKVQDAVRFCSRCFLKVGQVKVLHLLEEYEQNIKQVEIQAYPVADDEASTSQPPPNPPFPLKRDDATSPATQPTSSETFVVKQETDDPATSPHLSSSPPITSPHPPSPPITSPHPSSPSRTMKSVESVSLEMTCDSCHGNQGDETMDCHSSQSGSVYPTSSTPGLSTREPPDENIILEGPLHIYLKDRVRTLELCRVCHSIFPQEVLRKRRGKLFLPMCLVCRSRMGAI